MIFKSPDTDSKYKIVLENERYILCYRKIDDDRYRARIQIKGSGSWSIKDKLKFSASWSYKNAHFSIVTDTFHLRYALTDAFQAIFCSMPIDDKEEEKTQIIVDDVDESLDIKDVPLEQVSVDKTDFYIPTLADLKLEHKKKLEQIAVDDKKLTLDHTKKSVEHMDKHYKNIIEDFKSIYIKDNFALEDVAECIAVAVDDVK